MTNHREQREQRGARRLLAGLRVTPHDEALLAVVRPFLAETGSESELAYRLWRRGLELTLAEAVSVGAVLPPGTNEELIAGLVAQRLLLCVPLLRRIGMLTVLGVDGSAHDPVKTRASAAPVAVRYEQAIDQAASNAVVGLGGNDFL